MASETLARRLRAVEKALYSTQSPWAQQYWVHVKQQLEGEAVVEPKPKRPRRRQESIEDWAERIGCDLDDEYYRKYGELYVYPPSQLNNAKMDPFWGDHVAYGRHQARELLAEYERLLTQGAQS